MVKKGGRTPAVPPPDPAGSGLTLGRASGRVSEIAPRDYFQVRKHRSKGEQFAKGIPPCPEDFERDRGIVICAEGVSYFTCAWVAIRILRKHGCTLPIEVWHLNSEITDGVREALKRFNAECRNLSAVTTGSVSGYQCKPLAILHSSFQQVLYLHADNLCTCDPGVSF